MPREEVQEAAKVLFINAGERKEQVGRVEDYQVWILCWLPMQWESKLQQDPSTSPQRRWIISPYWPISSQKLIPTQPALERVWGAELKASGEGNKQRLARGQLCKQLITSTDYPQADVNHEERSHTKRIKSSLTAITSSGNERRSDGLQRGKLVVCAMKKSERAR